MSRRPRRNHTAELKSKMALAAIRGEKTLSELAEQFDIHPNQITQWKSQLLEGAASVFGGEAKAMPAAEAVDYMPRPTSDADLMLMRRIDELHLDYPFAGSRMLRDMLFQQGLEVGRRHVRTLMRKMSIEAIYRRPNTSKPAPGHRIYPYLLRGLAITRPNRVWAMDITYIPMARGFVYLAAVVDWFSRRVLACKQSITMETSFCVEALEEALSKNEKPDIFNTDQGSQFTSEVFTGRLEENGIAISMDGRGRWRDNVFVERIWKSIKYEEVYLHAYNSVSEARARIVKYIEFYNSMRPHSSLKALTPDQVYCNRLPASLAA